MKVFLYCLIIGMLILIAFRVEPIDREIKMPEPHAVTAINGERCLVYKGKRYAATMYVVICSDNSVTFTSDWTLIK